jgi:hypothetical protein
MFVGLRYWYFFAHSGGNNSHMMGASGGAGIVSLSGPS